MANIDGAIERDPTINDELDGDFTQEIDTVEIGRLQYTLKDTSARGDIAEMKQYLPIDLKDYMVEGKVLPTLKAVFTYRGKAVECKTVYVDEEIPGLSSSSGYYYIFGCSHDREVGFYDEYNWFFVYDQSLRFEKVIDIGGDDDVPDFIKVAFHVGMDARVKTLERAIPEIAQHAEDADYAARQSADEARRAISLFEESLRVMQNLPDGQAVSALVAQMSARLDAAVEELREKGELTDENATAIEQMRTDLNAYATRTNNNTQRISAVERTAVTYDIMEEAEYDPEWDGQIMARMRSDINILKQRLDNQPPSLIFDIENTNI